MRKEEHYEQIKVIDYLSILQRQGKVISYFAVPNGGSRNKLEAINLKREGVKAGVSDLVVILKNKVLFVEMKRKPKILKSGKISYTGIKVSDNQKKFLNEIKSSEVCEGFVAYGFDEFKNKIDNILKGKE